MSYEKVLAVLRAEPYYWPELVAPAPNATNVALGKGASVEGIAADLDSSCYGTEAPWGYPGTAYEYTRYSKYSIGVEYWELNTGQALGLQPSDPPVDKVDEAKTVSEWWNSQNNNRNRLGYKLWNPEDKASMQRHEQLFASARTVPPEWTVGTDPLIYQLACREGYIQPGMSGFHAAYASQNPKFSDVRGLTAQQWLDNLRAADRTMPRPWDPVKPNGKVPA